MATKVTDDLPRTRSGRAITNEVAEELADLAESDAKFEWTRKRPVGRPSLEGDHTSPRVNFRVPKSLHDAAAKRAIEEERTVSALAREALEKYLAS